MTPSNVRANQTMPANAPKTAVNGRAALLFLGFWCLFAAAEVANDWYTISSHGWSFAAGRYIAHAAFIFLPWFLFSLAMGSLQRTRLLAGSHWSTYACHTLLAIAVGLLHLLVVASSFWVFNFRGSMAPGFAAVYIELLFNWLHFEVLVYVSVLLVWQTIDRREPAAANSIRTSLHLTGRIADETHVVPASRIDWIAGADGNAIAHVGSDSIRVSESLKALQEKLGNCEYVRVHRSSIINTSRLRRIDGDYAVMANGDRVKCSRTGKRELKEALADS